MPDDMPPAAFEVAIVGGGLAGSIAASLLARKGHSVALIDRHTTYPPDFRAEQLVGDQTAKLARLGVFKGIVAGIRPIMHAVVGYRGRIIGRVDAPHYGVRYEDMVARVRAQIPQTVPLITGRVVDVQTGATQQHVLLADGRTIAARLVVIATGLQNTLLRRLGFAIACVRDAHSVAFGFDIVPAGRREFPFPLLVYQGEHPRQRDDYLTIFPMAGGTRANLFSYRGIRDPWTQSFLRSPTDGLRAALPGLQAVTGPFAITGSVETRVIDLKAVKDPIRDGIVLVGDAFQTSCPSTGSGVTRMLTDLDCLCLDHLPRWIASPGMAAEKIAAFYQDPRKLVADQAATHAAAYRRALATETDARWTVHRAQLQLRRRVGGLVGGPHRLTTGIRPIGGLAHEYPVAQTAGQYPLSVA